MNPQEHRKTAEQAYVNNAFDLPNAPIGSRDWCLFWEGFQAALAASPVVQTEPVAWRRYEKLAVGYRDWVYYGTKAWDDLQPLYTSPLPQVDALDGAKAIEVLKLALKDAYIDGLPKVEVIGFSCNRWNAAMKQGSN